MKKILITALVLAGFSATAQVKVGANPTSLATDAKFQVEGSTGAQTVILDNGNVGIGTTTPTEKLEVAGRVLLTNGFTATNAALLYKPDTDYMFIGPSTGTSTNGGVISLNGATYATNPGAIIFNTPGSGLTELFISGTNGNVGIGTTAPTEKLDVTGSIKMVDGNQGAGKLMVSDAAGKATWVAPGVAVSAASKWTNDATNTRVALTNLSDGTTARPAGTEFQISDSGSFGMGLSPNSNNRLWVEGLSKTLYTANANGETHNSIYASGQPIVNAGVTVTGGNHTSLNAGIVRTGATNAGAFTGVHSKISGVWSAYGHHTSLDPGAISENVFGFFANPYAQQGTITNLYDFYGANINTTGGTVTNRYGIAIEGTNKINYFMGNVGIGTTAPTQKLEVAGKVLLTDGFDATNAALLYKPDTDYMFIGPSTGTTTNGGAISLNGATYPTDPGAIMFNTPGTALTELFISGTTGNVGIGTTAPASKLHVTGLPVYADNATAKAALGGTGVAEGAFFHTGDGIVRVVF